MKIQEFTIGSTFTWAKSILNTSNFKIVANTMLSCYPFSFLNSPQIISSNQDIISNHEQIRPVDQYNFGGFYSDTFICVDNSIGLSKNIMVNLVKRGSSSNRYPLLDTETTSHRTAFF